MTATATKLTKVQTEALHNLYAGQLPFCRSAQTHNALSRAGLIDFEHGRGWVLTSAGLDAIGVEVEAKVAKGAPTAEAGKVQRGDLAEGPAVEPRAIGYGVQAPNGYYLPCDGLDVAREMHAEFPHMKVVRHEEGGQLVPVDTQPENDAEVPQSTYEAKLAEALENGFPELLAHKVAEIAARRSEPSSGSRTYTVIYTGMGEPIVHAAGCSHNLRDSLAGAHTTEDITGTLEEVGLAVYSDMLEEGSMSPEDCIPNLRIKPCAR